MVTKSVLFEVIRSHEINVNVSSAYDLWSLSTGRLYRRSDGMAFAIVERSGTDHEVVSTGDGVAIFSGVVG